MGGSSGQVTGYRYYANFLLFIGNPIEKLLGINFDKRGWLTKNSFSTDSMLNIDQPYLYGENEGGVFGDIDIYTGTSTQEVNTTYKNYMESIGLQASAYPYQSYLVFHGAPSAAEWSPAYGQPFYLGNSGYMKEMLLWPKRTRIRNDGRRQWYEVRGDGAVVCEIGADEMLEEFTQQAKAEIEATRWYAIDQNYGYYYSSRTLAQSFVYDFSTGGNVGANGYVYAEIVFSSPVRGGYFFINAKADDVGVLTATNAKVITLFDSGIQSGGTNYSFLVLIKDGATSVKLTFKVENKFIVYHRAEISLSYTSSYNIYDYKYDAIDINPIHKIREILTDDTAMNKPESSVNNANFMKAADRIYDEGLGISWSITEKSCIDAINELCYHIEAGIRVNRQTGLYEMVLFRDDWFEEDEIHTIPENKIKKGSMQYEITNADEVINQVNVNYYDRKNIKNSSFSISESGLIQTLGRVNAETVDFPYFMNMRNAEIVANWKLKILSTGVFKGSFSTGWREARKWNRYDLIRLPWSKRWVGTILVRIMSINLGGPTNNEVSIEFIEVVPATGMMNTTIVIDEPIDKPLPPQACQYEPFELPYYLAVMALGQRKVDEELAYENNFGLVGAVAEQPQSNSLYAIMMTHNGVEGEEWLRATSIHYSETADFDQIISKTSTSFTVNNWKKIANVSAGTLIKCGRDWLGTPGEWMVFQGVDPYTGIISVKRGALDTPPQEWGPGSKLYFCGNDVSYDQTEYVLGEEVLVSALTTTPSGVLEQGGSIPIEMKARAIRPYPPANVKINGEYWPAEIETDLILTWVDRNRVQQTGGEIIGWYEGSVTIEPGATYQLILIERDENNVDLRTQNLSLGTLNTYTFATSAMNANTRTIEITLKSLRDGYGSYQSFNHTVELSQFFSAPYDLTVEFKND